MDRNGVVSLYGKEDIIKIADDYIEEAEKAYENKQLKSALTLVQNALGIYLEQGEMEKYAHNLNTLGVFHAADGNQSDAINCYIEGLELCEEYNLVHDYNMFYNNIGTVFFDLDEYDKAIEYFEKTKEYLLSVIKLDKHEFDLYLLITYMNLCDAYRCVKDYEKALENIEAAEQMGDVINVEDYYMSFLVSKCFLKWEMGDKAYVYAHVEEIVKGTIEQANVSCYIPDIKATIDLFKEMKAYDAWKTILVSAEAYIEKQGLDNLHILLIEAWLSYYKESGDEYAYMQECVKYVNYSEREKSRKRKEKVANINMKMRLKKEERERKQAENVLYYDALTEVYNRHKLETDMEQAIAQCSKEQKPLSIGLVDIDYFKEINDTYGHTKGDECLQKVADVLKTAFEDKMKVYRYGGDEFVLMSSEEIGIDLNEVGEKIKDHIAQVEIKDNETNATIRMTVSQGYTSVIPDEGMTEQELLAVVDQTMYEVKKGGRDHYRVKA